MTETSTSENPQITWARIIADELCKHGLNRVILCPGSRSTPLVFSLSELSGIKTYVHLDERSAAFFALGFAKSHDRPMPIISTSGTGPANFHPAIIEASESEVPMIVLTADRPPELRDSGANQTIDQMKMFGDHVRWFQQLPEAGHEDRKKRSLRVKMFQAIQKSSFPSPGPVHINIPFRKPFEPQEEQAHQTPQTPETMEPYGEGLPLPSSTGTITWHHGSVRTTSTGCTRIVELMKSAQRPIVVAGPDSTRTDSSTATYLRAAKQMNLPILADPLSNLRYGEKYGHDQIYGLYDIWGSDTVLSSDIAPDFILRTGASPTSKPLRKMLSKHRNRQVVIHPTAKWTEAEFTATDCIQTEPAPFLEEMSDVFNDAFSSDWFDVIHQLERQSVNQLEQLLPDSDLEGSYIRTTLEDVPAGTSLFVSNSMPIRDLDRFTAPLDKAIEVYGNRGASGIDGVISTGLGCTFRSKQKPVIVTGDLALYHDMNGLAAIHRFDIPVVIIVIDNRGGGIFHKLPIANYDPPFTDHFLTPHDIHFEGIETIYNIPVSQVSEADQFSEELIRSLETSNAHLIRVDVDGKNSHRKREQITSQIRAELVPND